MCGRYRRTTQEEELARLYHIPIPKRKDLPTSYNHRVEPKGSDDPIQSRDSGTAARRLAMGIGSILGEGSKDCLPDHQRFRPVHIVHFRIELRCRPSLLKSFRIHLRAYRRHCLLMVQLRAARPLGKTMLVQIAKTARHAFVPRTLSHRGTWLRTRIANPRHRRLRHSREPIH
jgi:hypothetical protein